MSLEQGIGRYRKSIEQAQNLLDGAIDLSDHSAVVAASLAPPGKAFEDITGDHVEGEPEFHKFVFTPKDVQEHPEIFVNRVFLHPNRRTSSYSPVVITPNPNRPGKYYFSMFHLPYDPKTGITDGYWWAVSMESQSRVPSFGGHGSNPSGFEQGHFVGAILAAARDDVAAEMIQQGDRKTHQLIEIGATEVLGVHGLLPEALRPTTVELPNQQMALYWHDRMKEGARGGDFPGATTLQLGAAFNSLGTDRDLIYRIKSFTDTVVSGITEFNRDA